MHGLRTNSRLLTAMGGFGTRSRALILSALAIAVICALPSAAAAGPYNVSTKGEVIAIHPHVYAIFWGSNWNSEPAAAERAKIETMFGAMSNSPWEGILTQYWSPVESTGPAGTSFAFVSKEVAVSSYTDGHEGGAPSNVTQEKLEAEIAEAIKANKSNGWPQQQTADYQYMVFAAPGTTYSPEFPYYGGGACAMHSRGFLPPPGGSFAYGFVGWDFPGVPSKLCWKTVAGAHEWAETVTEPMLSGNQNGWTGEGSETEVADLCADIQEKITLAPGVEVSKLWDMHAGTEGACSSGNANPPQIPPKITTEAEPVSAISDTEATLNGSFELNDFNGTYSRFKWGTSESYGHETTAEPVKGPLYFHPPMAMLSGLQPATTYHYRLIVGSGGFYDTKLKGEDRTFRTAGPPKVTTEPVSHNDSFEPQLNGTVNPEGLITYYQFEYGETTAYGTKIPIPLAKTDWGREPVPVSQTLKGLKRNTTYHFRITGANTAGAATPGVDRSFTTLSNCKNGTEQCEWSLQTSANPKSPVDLDSFEGVSCSSSTLCMGVGNNGNTGKGFAEFWNGSKWEMLGDLNSEAKAISCPSTTYCLAIAKNSNAAWNVRYLFGSWQQPEPVTPPTPSGATLINLKGVSCTSASACTAVGSYYAEGKYRTLADRWNGTSWSQQTTPLPSEGEAKEAMLGVSCDSATSCTAVGVAASKPFAERWNGTAWSLSTVPNPAGATSANLQSVSCPTASACTAVGSYVAEGKNKTLAEAWNGTSWSKQSTPNPAEEGLFLGLNSVSCLSASSCTAVGQNSFLPSGSKTVVESWNGTAWTLQSAPSPAGTNVNNLRSVSCSSSIACTAVGSSRPGLESGNQLTLADRYE